MIKRIEDLSKKERQEYYSYFWNNCANKKVRKMGGKWTDAADVHYVKEHNTVEEIAYWLKHEATTTIFPGTPANWCCTVYMFNRLHEYCSANDKGAE